MAAQVDKLSALPQELQDIIYDELVESDRVIFRPIDGEERPMKVFYDSIGGLHPIRRVSRACRANYEAALKRSADKHALVISYIPGTRRHSAVAKTPDEMRRRFANNSTLCGEILAMLFKNHKDHHLQAEITSFRSMRFLLEKNMILCRINTLLSREYCGNDHPQTPQFDRKAFTIFFYRVLLHRQSHHVVKIRIRLLGNPTDDQDQQITADIKDLMMELDDLYQQHAQLMDVRFIGDQQTLSQWADFLDFILEGKPWGIEEHDDILSEA